MEVQHSRMDEARKRKARKDQEILSNVSHAQRKNADPVPEKPVRESDEVRLQNKDDDIPVKPARQDVEQAVEKLRRAPEIQNNSLDFRVQEVSDTLQVEVLDTRQNKVLLKIPPADILRLAADIKNIPGLFRNRRL